MIARYTTLLIVVHAVANISIGVSLWMWANLSAETVLRRYGPEWLWPAMFVMAGVFACIGIWYRPMAQFSFLFAAIVTTIFGIASLYAVVANQMLAAIPTTVFLLYIAILKVVISIMVRQHEIEHDNIIKQVTAATEKGKSALDNQNDGTVTNTGR